MKLKAFKKVLDAQKDELDDDQLIILDVEAHVDRRCVGHNTERGSATFILDFQRIEIKDGVLHLISRF